MARIEIKEANKSNVRIYKRIRCDSGWNFISMHYP
jgi:hypothetical protein